jgi:hypothetical protein
MVEQQVLTRAVEAVVVVWLEVMAGLAALALSLSKYLTT